MSRGFLKSKTEIKKLQNWNWGIKEFVYKDAISDGFWFELHYLSVINDLESFRVLFFDWEDKIKSLAANLCSTTIYYKAEFIVPVSIWLLEQEDVMQIERTIVDECGGGFVTKMEERTLEKLKEKLARTP